jgi:hypothetical protein
MSLTAQQIVDVRTYMGYSVSGDTTSFPFREYVYSDVSLMGLSIEYRLEHLSAEEENRVTTFYLPNLAAREQEIQCAAANLSTDVAGPWKHNKQEIRDRRELFDELRYDLCDFLGFAPGEALRRSNRLVRA